MNMSIQPMMHRNRITPHRTFRSQKHGLVLLVVLGMLALFTLLAITYLTISGQSRSSSVLLVRAKLQQSQLKVDPDSILNQLLSGTKNSKSALYGHSLLEDVYGRDAIEGTFNFRLSPPTAELVVPASISLVKLQLDDDITINPDSFRLASSTDELSYFSKLSVENDTYTGRLITFLDGPAKDHTFRILSHVGSPGIRSGASSFYTELENSIVIDLGTMVGETAEVTFTISNRKETFKRSIRDWMQTSTSDPHVVNSTAAFNPAYLIADNNGTPYRYVMNDLAFNGVGYGVESDPTLATFGNLDQSRIVPGTSGDSVTGYAPGSESFPIALLPNYDYLTTDSRLGSIGYGMVGGFPYEVNGSTNEGFDVADYRDYFLAHIPERWNPVTGSPIPGNIPQGMIIPSFHRPEIINYIANYLNSQSGGSLTREQILRLVQLVDYASARPLSYHLKDGGADYVIRNPDFTGRTDDRGIPHLEIDIQNSATAIPQLRTWIQALTGASDSTDPNRYWLWDVDNDGEGSPDSVWIDPRLPLLTAADGRPLKALVAPLIIDLDGRVNINLTGDSYQIAAYSGSDYQTVVELGSDPSLIRYRAGGGFNFVPQGLGYGPAEIALGRLFGNRTQSLFVTRYGVDGEPGTGGQGVFGQYFHQRELRFGSDGYPYGLKQSRRGRMAYALDQLGNLRMVDSNNLGASNELVEDTYEVNSHGQTPNDSSFSLTELETLLRRFDRDASMLPNRLKNQMATSVSLNDAIYNSITTRSVELRNPNQAAVNVHRKIYSDPEYLSSAAAPSPPLPTAANTPSQSYDVPYPRRNSESGTNYNSPVQVSASPYRLIANGRQDGSFLRWVQMLYDARYPEAQAHPELNLNLDDIRMLFPLEFRKALRMDINRPFGNGRDEDNDGMIDDPEELASYPAQSELFPTSSGSITWNGTYYDSSVIQGNSSDPNWANYIQPLQSRVMLARQLYVLAQLVVPRDYMFPGVSASPNVPWNTSNSNDMKYRRIRARYLAQWAVNVVDFRDSDSAMTRFEYDETPFERDIVSSTRDNSVWQPKGENVVWGMEFPEIQLSETFSSHDKRTKDSDDNLDGPDADGDQGKYTSAGMNPDNDFDQYRLPEASSFIELVVPRSPQSPQLPTTGTNGNPAPAVASNLYDNSGKLYLSKLAPSSTGLSMPAGVPASADYERQPVFRVGIARIPDANNDPGRVLAASAGSNNWERISQLSNQTSSTVLAGARNMQVSGSSLTPAQLSASNFNGLTSDLAGDVALPPMQFDRIVWFANKTVATSQSIPDLIGGDDPAGTRFNERTHRVYRNPVATDIYVPGGGYVVVGPRQETRFGSLNTSIDPPENRPSQQRIFLNNGSVGVYDQNNSTLVSANAFANTITMRAVATPPIEISSATAWTDTPVAPQTKPIVDDGIGFNISAPTPIYGRYYTLPTKVLNDQSMPQIYERLDSWANIRLGEKTLPDLPFDYDPDPLLERLASENKQYPGTYLGHRVAYLQRLADPDLAYHPTLNPYITIDWMSMDLTVFNGEDTPNSSISTETNPVAGAPNSFAFQSRFKDGARISDAVGSFDSVDFAAMDQLRYASMDISTPGLKQTGSTFFSSSTAQMIRSTPATLASNDYFSYVVGVPNASTVISNSSLSLGYGNIGLQNTGGFYTGFGPSSTNTGTYIGAPPHTLSGLNWLDRPFTNTNELLMVPWVAPGQLGVFFSTPGRLPFTGTPEAPAEDRFETTATRNANLPPTGFAHLAPFISSDIGKVQPVLGLPIDSYWQQRGYNVSSSDAQGSDLYLLLDLIETQNPYEDGDVYVNPNNLNLSSTIGNWMLGNYSPPFNQFPRYTASGKVNLNTIRERGVWEAVEWNFDKRIRNNLTTADSWLNMSNDRRGYQLNLTPTYSFVGATIYNPMLHSDIPTQFKGAYRPGWTSNIDVVNQPIGTAPPPSTPDRSSQTMRDHRGIISTTLRPSSNPGGLSPQRTLNRYSMTHRPDLASITGTATATSNLYAHSELARSPFANYQRAMRLTNLTTNQSNVFAVWLTVGLFEFDPEEGIGKEYIGPSGTPERSKSFYIIDRSIPVGFAPGKSFNSEKTVLLRRKIPR